MKTGYRQEVFNVLLAQLLRERGVITAPEEALVATPERKRRIPDVIVTFQGLRLVIEGEVDDQPDAEKRAMLSARMRVVEGISHIGVAVIYPAYLRSVEFKELKPEIQKSSFSIVIITEAGEAGPTKGNLNDLENGLRRAFEKLIEEDVVAQAVAVLEASVEKFAGSVVYKPGVVSRLAKNLGIRKLESKGDSDSEEYYG